MHVIYRITDIPSTNPSLWGKDKKEINRVCLKSFVEAFRDVRPSVHFIADHCDDDIYDLIEKTVPFNYNIERTKIGINNTMVLSYELASRVYDYVLFQECDYLYRPNIGGKFIQALHILDIVSPYDHKNFYMDAMIHSSTCEVILVDGVHYRSTERNTMTWGTHSRIVKENLETLKKHGYLDDEVWRDLELAGHRLWVPIPSFSTHMVKDYLAPSVAWEDLWQIYQSQ